MRLDDSDHISTLWFNRVTNDHPKYVWLCSNRVAILQQYTCHKQPHAIVHFMASWIHSYTSRYVNN